MLTFVDSHAHYEDEAFDKDRDALLSALPGKGALGVINAASSVESSRRAAQIAARHGFVYCTAGVHPHDAQNAEDGYLKELEALASDAKNVALGEIGLDYYYDNSPREAQRRVFSEQLALAKALGKPVVIHEREAYRDTVDILRGFLPLNGVFHCFSGGKEAAREVLSMGFYISLGGVLTFKNAKKAPEAALYAPSDRLLVETDAPYLAPAPHRGKRNDSSHIPLILERLAQIRGERPEDAALATAQNAEALFGKKFM